MERMEVRYQLHVGDLAYAKPTLPWIWRWWWRGGMFFVLMLSMLPATLLLLFMEAYILAAITWVFLFALMGHVILNMRNHEERQQTSVEQGGEIHLMVQPDCMESQNEQGWSRRSWTYIASTKLTDRHVVLNIKPLMFHVIPQTAFAVPEDAARFVKLAERCRRENEVNVAVSLPALPEKIRLRSEPHLASVTFQGTHDELHIYFSSNNKLENQEQRKAQKRGPLGTIIVLMLITLWMLGASQLMIPMVDRNFFALPLGIVSLLVSVIIGFWATRLIANRLVRSLVTSIPLGVETHSITPQGVLVDGFYCQSWQSWMVVDRISDNDSHLVFWQGPLAVHLIPKRAFASHEAAREFQQTAEHARQEYRDTHDNKKLKNQPSAVETGNPYQPPQSL